MDIKTVVDSPILDKRNTPPPRRLPPVPSTSVDSPSSSGSSSPSNSPTFSLSQSSTFSDSSPGTSPSSSPFISPRSPPSRALPPPSPSQKPPLLPDSPASSMVTGKRVSRPLPKVPERNLPSSLARKPSTVNLQSSPSSNQAHLSQIHRPPLPSASPHLLASSFNVRFSSCQGQGQLVCKKCFLDVTSSLALVPVNAIPPGSRSFRGFSGKAALFTEVYNVNPSPPRVQLMSTGAHTMQDAICSGCATLLGWRIVRAHEKPEKWKEGRWLMELECLRLKPRVPEDIELLEEEHDWMEVDEPTRGWAEERATAQFVGRIGGYPYARDATKPPRPGMNAKMYKGNSSVIHLPLTVHG